MQNLYELEVLLALSAATIVTRCIILFLPQKYVEAPILKRFNAFFPAIILTLLIIYSVKNANFKLSAILSTHFAYPEIIAIIVTILTHIFGKRNALLSMLIGTSTYIILHQLWRM